MGTMPPTALLLTKGDFVVGHFASYTDIGTFLGISINDKGWIIFQGNVMNPSYVLDTDPDPYRNGFTKQAAIRDWCRCHMRNNIPDYRIYRFLK